MKNGLEKFKTIASMYRHLFEENSLPEFLIIGAQKGGTTSLYSYLCQHPGIIPCAKKEVHFFGNPDIRKRGETWYRRHFPTSSHRKSLERELGYSPITGEATPDMNQPFMPRLVYELLPNAKLIAMLRDPIDRAFSQYHHKRKITDDEHLTFDEAIAQSVIKLPDELMDDPYLYYKSDHRSYITRGLYAEQLERWYQYYPKDRILISSSEEFFADPASTLKKVLKFLEMPDYKFDCSVAKNIGGYKSEMTSKVRQYLEEIFRPHNRRLYELVGIDFGWPS